MDRGQKEALVGSLNALFSSATLVVVTRPVGLTVAQSTDLRRQMREAGASFKVTKNRLTRLALKGTPFAEDEAYRKARPDLITRLEQLRTLHNVKLELCEITREAVQLPKDKVIEGVQPVRSGVVRIAELQSKGYAYLKVE